jgi:hypothetical protein
MYVLPCLKFYILFAIFSVELSYDMKIFIHMNLLFIYTKIGISKLLLLLALLLLFHLHILFMCRQN